VKIWSVRTEETPRTMAAIERSKSGFFFLKKVHSFTGEEKKGRE
jgi:hypothetical protein